MRLTFRFIFMVMTLLFGMLIGMNMAEKGIYRVAGNLDEDVKSFQVVQNENQFEIKVLGKKYVSNLPEKENQSLNENSSKLNASDNNTNMSNISLINNIGNKLGAFFQSNTEKGLNILAGLID